MNAPTPTPAMPHPLLHKVISYHCASETNLGESDVRRFQILGIEKEFVSKDGIECLVAKVADLDREGVEKFRTLHKSRILA